VTVNLVYNEGSPNNSPPSSQQKALSTPPDGPSENSRKLWRAAGSGHLYRVRLSLHRGSDISFRCGEHGTTALHQAAKNVHETVFEALLDAGASIDDEDNEDAVALHFARREFITAVLIAAGADVDHEDRKGRTPGRRALERQNMDVVESLIRARSDTTKTYCMV
jgi:ankyrin repeat protein